MRREERFGLVLTSDEKQALDRLAEQERISAAAVLRRLLWQAAQNTPPVQSMHPSWEGQPGQAA